MIVGRSKVQQALFPTVGGSESNELLLLWSLADPFYRSLFTTVGRSFLTMLFCDLWLIVFNDSFVRSIIVADWNPPTPFYHRASIDFNGPFLLPPSSDGNLTISSPDRWAIGFERRLFTIVTWSLLTIPFYHLCWMIGIQRSLITIVGRTFLAIPFCFREPIRIQRCLATIVDRLCSTIPLFRSLADRNSTFLWTIVGRPESNDLFLQSIVERSDSNDHFWRSLADRVWPSFLRSPLADQIEPSHFYDCWPIVLNDPFSATVGRSGSKDASSGSMADRV